MSPVKIFGRSFGWPVITLDLHRRRDRAKVLLFFVVLFVIGLALVVGGVQTYAYTESTQFCGTTCHSMLPQYTRFQESSHAHVACAHCHVGPGAEAFIQSKITGTRQLVDTIFDSFERPIPSPVKNLRPARETCEECHSPRTFKDNIVKVVRHYDDDKENTPVESTLILKMGGWSNTGGIKQGIHWHIFSKVEYVALDEQRQVIGWVGVERPDGTQKEFFARDLLGMSQTTFVEEAVANDEVREMDCIDCHNRAAHYIPYPEQVVDQAITDGLISRDLPYIRMKAVELLTPKYETVEDAMTAIDGLADYYKEQSSSASGSNVVPLQKVEQAIESIKNIYNETNFPDMELNWETNPNNSRHRPTLGCFRCHDGNHVTDRPAAEQETISAECNLCHTVPIVGRGDNLLVEAPVIVGNVPASHAPFSWTVSHRNVTDAEKQECFNCHGQAFCNNGACHNLNHPENMLFTHAQEYKTTGDAVCYTCHQNVFCSRCHPGGVLNLP